MALEINLFTFLVTLTFINTIYCSKFFCISLENKLLIYKAIPLIKKVGTMITWVLMFGRKDLSHAMDSHSHQLIFNPQIPTMILI